MLPLFYTILTVVLVYIGVLIFLPKSVLNSPSRHTQKTLARIFSESGTNIDNTEEELPVLRSYLEDTPLGRMMLGIPGAEATYSLLLKAGFSNRVLSFFLSVLVLFMGALLFSLKMDWGLWGVVAAIAVTILVPRAYLKWKIERRNDKFINMFPDALDMIVRSVRSGFPINTALKMIADNMDPPVSTEFKRVVDEVAYGRPLNEALLRLGERTDRPDVQFFIVVLTVQQEVGGNLSEIISNLSNIIRKRKQLRLRIKAMTSEGRATAWVLGALPVFLFITLRIVAPKHLEPLYTTSLGHIMLGSAIGLVLLAGWIVYKMAKIEI
jgi:tight adherence protein B